MRSPITSTAIYEDLKRKISSGEIRSGEYLIEVNLTETYQVSRTPIRQALHLLEDDGLVKSIPRKGTYVKFLNTEDVIEVYQAADALEGMAVSLVTLKKSCDLNALRSLNQKMDEALDRFDVATWCLLDEKFHEQLVHSCGNATLIKLYDNLKVNMRRVRTFYSSIWHDKKHSCEEHTQILDRIERGDASNAQILVQNHYRSVINHAVVMMGLEASQNPQQALPLTPVEI